MMQNNNHNFTPTPSTMIQDQKMVRIAYERIRHHLELTPVVTHKILNQLMGRTVFLKLDNQQKTGAFKIRGVLNNLLRLQELGQLPEKIVAYSTGNHAIAVAYAAKIMLITARIYLPMNVSLTKIALVQKYGAEVILTATRQEAEDRCRQDGANDYHYLPPSDDDAVIAGAGTMCYEALQQLQSMQLQAGAIFASCSGGGLLSGTYLARNLLSPGTKIIGVEPENANDAYLSIKNSSIFRFTSSPETIADGLKALSVSKRSFAYLQQLNDFTLVSESDILHWTSWLINNIGLICEPSSAISMAAAFNWSRHNDADNLLVLISGGNISQELKNNLLNNVPTKNIN